MNEPILSNEVIMAAMAIKGAVTLVDPTVITPKDVELNLEHADSSLPETERRQIVEVAFAFAFPQARKMNQA